MVNVDRTHDLQIFQSDTLPTELSAERGNHQRDIKFRYIGFLARLTLEEVERNSEYHAPRNIILW